MGGEDGGRNNSRLAECLFELPRWFQLVEHSFIQTLYTLFAAHTDNGGYCSHFREVETEAQRGYIFSSGSHL